MRLIEMDYDSLRTELAASDLQIKTIWEFEVNQRFVYTELFSNDEIPLLDFRTFLAYYDYITCTLLNMPYLYAIDILNREGYEFKNIFGACLSNDTKVHPRFMLELFQKLICQNQIATSKQLRSRQVWIFCEKVLTDDSNAFQCTYTDRIWTLKLKTAQIMNNLVNNRFATRKKSKNHNYVHAFARHYPNVTDLGIYYISKTELLQKWGPLNDFIGEPRFFEDLELTYPSRTRYNYLYDFQTSFEIAKANHTLRQKIVQEQIARQFLFSAKSWIRHGQQKYTGNIFQLIRRRIEDSNIALSEIRWIAPPLDTQKLSLRMGLSKYIKVLKYIYYILKKNPELQKLDI